MTERSTTVVTLDKIRAETVRRAAMDLSDAEDMHQGEGFGPDACLGCRWRARLTNYADEIEMGDHS